MVLREENARGAADRARSGDRGWVGANMADVSRKRTCFVVMPFGEKKDADGQDIDFNDIYEYFFKRTIAELDIVCTRCDEIDESGSIHEKMIREIYQSDIVVVDITTSNANVYYELGIRHALSKCVTLLIRRKGTIIPFNIQGLQVVEYDQTRFRSIESAKGRIHEIIKNGLTNRKNDSPVHQVLDLNIEPEGKPLDTKFHEAPLKNAPDLCVGLVTGDIQNVEGIDVWVNNENTFMQMARIFDNSISGIVRSLGGRNPVDGEFVDTIAKELLEQLKGKTSVSPADVLVTTSGSLNSYGVKKIFHVAANVGQVGRGFMPIDDMASCVTNVLKEGKKHSGTTDDEKLTSVLFPLMGTRSRRGSVVEDRVNLLIDAAVDYLESNPKCTFRKVYFLAYTDREFDICSTIMQNDKERLLPLTEIKQASGESLAEPQVSASYGAGSIAGSLDRGETFARSDIPANPPSGRSGKGTGSAPGASAQKKPARRPK